MSNDNDAQSQPVRQHSLSHLFLVRVWTEPSSQEEPDVTWTGKIQHVKSGEAHTFHDWQTLVALLAEMALKWEEQDSNID